MLLLYTFSDIPENQIFYFVFKKTDVSGFPEISGSLLLSFLILFLVLEITNSLYYMYN